MKENDALTRVIIEDIAYPPVEATEDEVSWSPLDVVKLQAYVLPRSVIGTVHSHPDCTPHLSKADIVSAQVWGEIVSAVFSYWKDKDSKLHTSMDCYYGARRI